jgi:lysophospholipase L1-like esterase
MDDEAKVLVCFGDSNTHGTVPMDHLDDVRRFGLDARWTGLLASNLGQGWRVIEEGLPGRTTVHPDPIEGTHLSGLAALPIVIGTHTPIDALVIMLGTNDLKPRFSVGPIDIAASTEILVGTIRTLSAAPGRRMPQILLVAPPPILEVGCLAEMFAGGAAKSRALGMGLQRVADRTGVAFLNAGEHIRSSPTDGVHFDSDQHRILADEIGAALRSGPRTPA